MRFRHRDGSIVHLSYCGTVHPAGELEEVIARLDGVAAMVRKELDQPRLGVGLWLAPALADRLANSPIALGRLQRALDRNSLEVTTLNGFPYSGFKGPEIREGLYQPDWTQPERLRYTLDLIEVLTKLLPPDAEYGSLSTLPLAWRFPWSRAQERVARDAFVILDHQLARTEERTGRRIRVGVEPEPGCVLEMIPQATAWLNRYQSPYAGMSRIGLCLDTCHLAVQFEEPADTFDELWRAGVDVVKCQLSAAPQIVDPADTAGRWVLRELVRPPRFLHQVREWSGPGVDDVEQMEILSGHAAWRAHFHVPVHAELRPPLTSTTGVMLDCLARLVGGARPLTHHLELETYAWSASPTSTGKLVTDLAAELAWVRVQLLGLGLEEVS